jgi:hypothetical protein
MTKEEAVGIFGSQKDLCIALGIVRKTFYNWPDPLPQTRIDQIRGAYMRIAEEKDGEIIYRIGWSEDR